VRNATLSLSTCSTETHGVPPPAWAWRAARSFLARVNNSSRSIRSIGRRLGGPGSGTGGTLPDSLGRVLERESGTPAGSPGRPGFHSPRRPPPGEHEGERRRGESAARPWDRRQVCALWASLSLGSKQESGRRGRRPLTHSAHNRRHPSGGHETSHETGVASRSVRTVDQPAGRTVRFGPVSAGAARRGVGRTRGCQPRSLTASQSSGPSGSR
jgi:hypothetical protein